MGGVLGSQWSRGHGDREDAWPNSARYMETEPKLTSEGEGGQRSSRGAERGQKRRHGEGGGSEDAYEDACSENE